LFMVYQPQVDIESQTMVGMEALLRWRHPERGLIPPLEFIKIAEQSSLINQIGDWVLEEVCKQMRAWLDKKLKIPRVSINISARHLRSDALSKTLIDTAAKYKISPSMICIEITEHALLEEVETVKNNMRLIKEAGFAISLDDFGMGHSSLLYLKRWSVDELKIDRSFVEGLVTNDDDRVIVKAISALSDALNLNLMAEGVETQLQADILLDSGCKNVQGYFYSTPIESKELQKMLKK
jgi:EAL domain-containing protein (putative c-di-GMP-specific phosphodiesterase class I)